MYTMQQLLDRQEIVDLSYKYAHFGATRRIADRVLLFTEDCEFNYTSSDNSGRGRDALGRFLTKTGGQWEAYHLYLTNHLITFDADDSNHAAGILYLFGWYRPAGAKDSSADVHKYSEYHDEYRKTAGGWLIEKRTAKRIGSSAGGGKVLPDAGK
jgi:hypothetical protein